MTRSGIFWEHVRLLASEADRGIRTRLGSALVLTLAGSVLTGLAPLALKQLIDALTQARAVQESNAVPTWIPFAAAYLLALLAGRVLTEIRPLLAGVAEQRLHARISRRYFAHLLALPLGFHANRQTGALTSSLSQATAGCQLVVASLMQCLPVIAETITVLTVLSRLGQPALVAIFACSAAAYAFVFATGATRVRTHGRSVSEASLGLHATLADSLLNIEAIKCFNAAAAIRDRFDSATAALESRWAGLHGQRARTGLAVAGVFAASIGASLFVAADSVARGTLTIGGFVLATVYMLQMVRPLEMLGMAVRDVAQAIEFARPMLDVMHAHPEVAQHQRPLPEPGDTHDGRTDAPAGQVDPPEIAFHDVHLAYQDNRPVLQGFSLEVAAGTTVAIVGASGAGKSSIVRLLLRLLDARSGRILWDRVPIDQLSVETLRSRIGVVPQDTTLFNDTIAANIAIGRPGATRADIEAAAHRAQLHTHIQSLLDGYETQVGERGLKLSGGERQRIAIARAVLKRPQVYVFDEVSSMLDGPTEAALLMNLRDVCTGCTTIFITHRLAAARMADHIVVLDNGKVIERGNHAELIALGRHYARTWQSQSRGGAAQPCCASADEVAAAPGR